MALLVGSLTLLLAGCTPQDLEKKLRFGEHTGVTKQAEQMRTLWTWAGVTALAVGVLMWGLIFWAIIFHRKKSDELPKQFKYNLPLEIVYSVVPIVIVAGLFYRTVVVENYVNKLSKNPDVLIQVDAFKWNWQFEYHSYKDATGAVQTPVYSGTNPSQTTPPTPYYVSTVGSDNEIPILVVPVGQTVQIIEHSYDVVHSFWVPEFLFKRDVIPYGRLSAERDNRFEFTATSTGSFVGRCAELCGTYHSQMNFEVRVVQPDVFRNYVQDLLQIGPDAADRQAKALTMANVPGGPYATTTYPFNTDRSARSASEKSGS
jgi:cytochrome c oxidase subunit 2